jgi:thioredoxin 1
MSRTTLSAIAAVAAALTVTGVSLAQTTAPAPARAPADAMRHDDAMHPATPAAHRFTPFTQAAFNAAKRAGRPILVDVYASWCPVCRAQQPAIDAAAADPANRGLTIFRLDFDSQRAEQRPLGVTGQATLIAFRGQRETGRLMGERDPAAIARLVATTRAPRS